MKAHHGALSLQRGGLASRDLITWMWPHRMPVVNEALGWDSLLKMVIIILVVSVVSYCEGGHIQLIPSQKLTCSHLKMDGWNTSFLLGWPIFRCRVSFRECNLYLFF